MVKTDPRTRQDYPEDGTLVTALFDGSAHWYTGTVHSVFTPPYGATDQRHRIEGAGGFLEDAAHWYEL